MKTIKISIILLLFCGLNSNSYSQCGGGPIYGTYSVTITNNTNCDFTYAWEAGQSDCEGCGGASGVISANSQINSDMYNCSSPDTKCDYLNWAVADPVIRSGCSISVSSEDYNNANCGGSQISGSGSGCCVNSWDVTISGNNIDIN